MRDRVPQLWSDHKGGVFRAFGIALVAFTAFGFGRATAPAPKKVPLTVEPLPITAQLQASNLIPQTDLTAKSPEPPATRAPQQIAKNFVASKSGTKYYLPTCSGVKRIKEENKIWFSTAQEAKDAGYEPAANCPGL